MIMIDIQFFFSRINGSPDIFVFHLFWHSEDVNEEKAKIFSKGLEIINCIAMLVVGDVSDTKQVDNMVKKPLRNSGELIF